MNLLSKITAVIGAAFFALPGLWAYLSPREFHANIATFPPYSQHLVHDMGAFMVAIGLALLLALFWSDALSTVFAAAAVGSILSGIAHLIDTDLGGRPIVDPVSLFGMAALLLVALVLRRRQLAKG